MHKVLPLLFLPVFSALAAAQAPSVQISIGVRETGFSGGTFTGIGSNGAAVGGIEWVNRDGQTLVLDGTWQQFTFQLTVDPIVGFAGTSANSILEGTFGTLENIRILNANGYTEPIQIWIDDIENTVTPTGSGPVTTSVQNFEGFAEGQEVTFQEPSFSGSTTGNLVLGSTAGIQNVVASRSASDRLNFQFLDNSPVRWLRLTTFNSLNGANPQIRFDDNSVVTFWMRGGVCQEDLGFAGPGPTLAEMCGTGLGAGESSTYFVANTQPAAPGLVTVCIPGFFDVPLAGGLLVSGGGYLTSVALFSGPTGTFTLPVSGSPFPADVVLQSLWLDPLLPQAVAFTNALRVRFGV